MRRPHSGTTDHILQDRWDREQGQPFLMALLRAECEDISRGKGKPGLESPCVVAGGGEGKGKISLFDVK